MSMLNEFLQDKYVENFEIIDGKYNTKIEGLTNLYAQYFYIPVNEHIGGLRYIVDNDGHALYLIKKSGLPKEIKDVLVGGDAGEGTYADYASLNDVYGVTSDLKVYYCYNGVDSILGLSSGDLDNDNPKREVFGQDSKMSNILGKMDYDLDEDGIINAEEARYVKSFTINPDDGINDFSDFYNLTSLMELTIDSKSFSSLEGIQNCGQLYYIYFKNSTVGDYSALCGLVSKLKYLYFYDIDDSEFSKVCDGMKTGKFSNLNYFGVFGCELSKIIEGEFQKYYAKTAEKCVSNISGLSILNTDTKMAIKNLYLHCNEINDISSLANFSGLTYIRLEENKISDISSLSNLEKLERIYLAKNLISDLTSFSEISTIKYLIINDNSELTTLNGIQNNKLLSYLCCENCNLGLNETESKNNTDALSYIDSLKIYYLNVQNNNELKHIAYGFSDLQFMYLSGCPGLLVGEIREIRDKYNSLSDTQKSINSDLTKYLNTNKRIDYYQYSEKSLTNDSNEIRDLINNKDVCYLRLDGNTALTDEVSGETLSLNQILSSCTNLEVLSLRNLNISSITFVENMPNLKELDLWDCNNITDLSPLEDTDIKLSALRINNEDIVLSNIPKTLSNLEPDGNPNTFIKQSGAGYEGGLYASKEVYEKLETCKNLTRIDWSNHLNTGAFIDLSETKVTYVRLSYPGLQLKLPKSCTEFYASYNACKYRHDFSLCDKLKVVTFREVTTGLPDDSWEYYLNQLSNCSLLENLSIDGRGFNDLSSISVLSSCENLRELTLTVNSDGKVKDLDKLPSSLEKLTLKNFSISKLDEFVKFKSLYYLSLSNNQIKNIDGISGLVNLKYLDLSNNQITSIYALRNMKKLGQVYGADKIKGSLNLSNNLLYDPNYYEDESRNSYL